jgi:hypothetical protein
MNGEISGARVVLALIILAPLYILSLINTTLFVLIGLSTPILMGIAIAFGFDEWLYGWRDFFRSYIVKNHTTRTEKINYPRAKG